MRSTELLHRSGGQRHPGHFGCGFTLLELLMVLAVMTILAGMLGVALGGRRDAGGGLANGSDIVAGLVGAAKAEAALHATNARLIVHAQPPPGGSAAQYLRMMQVVREDPFESGAYVAAGAPVVLPGSVCIIPPAPMPADHLGPGVNWPVHSAASSMLMERHSFQYLGRAGAGAQFQYFDRPNSSGRILFLQFGSDGFVSNPPVGARIILAAARSDGTGPPRFTNPHDLRGVIVRRSGAVSIINNPEDL